jgi:tripartite ATP-independent transporter DctM subunit
MDFAREIHRRVVLMNFEEDISSMVGAQCAVPNADIPGGWIARSGYRIEALIGAITELPAALLVLAELLLLLANVIFRYVLNMPLNWGDELASLLFIWLAMLGVVIALRRGEHMRLTVFVSKMTPSMRAFSHCLVNVIVVAFVLMLIGPAWEYAQDQWPIITPALEIQGTFRVASIVVGAALMLVLALVRLMEQARTRDLAISVGVVSSLTLIIWIGKPMFAVLGMFNLVLFFLVGVAALVVLSVPIFVAFGIATLAYLSCMTAVPLTIVVSRMDEGMSHMILLAVPLFVLLGSLMEAMGLAAAIIRLLIGLVGHVRGGLSYALIGAIYLVSGISGSKVADMAAVAPALFPEMRKRGADDGELVSILGTSAAMSETIPPSVVLITIGSVTGVSIASLFTSGFVPAMVGAIALAAVVCVKSRGEDMRNVTRATRAETFRAFLFAFPAMALLFVIRSAVVEGVATATEVSTIGVAYTFVVGLLLYRSFNWSRFIPILIETASLSGTILIIIGCATAMAWALTQSGFSRILTDFMVAMPGGKVGFLITSAVAFVVLGSFLEGIPAIVLFGPVLFPAARAIGIHEVHYTMVVVFAMGLGLFAPPFGVGFFAACAISKVSPDHAMKRVWPYLSALFVALLLIALVPWISVGFL